MIELNKTYIIKQDYKKDPYEENNTNIILIILFLKKIQQHEPNLISIIKSIVDTYFYSKEQVVTIDGTHVLDDGILLYSFNYGVFGFHEGYACESNVRELTDGEKEYKQKNEFWNLPQQFYQS